jgi:hypothetical protein
MFDTHAVSGVGLSAIFGRFFIVEISVSILRSSSNRGCIVTLDLLERFSWVKKETKITDFWIVDVFCYDAYETPCSWRYVFLQFASPVACAACTDHLFLDVMLLKKLTVSKY